MQRRVGGAFADDANERDHADDRKSKEQEDIDDHRSLLSEAMEKLQVRNEFCARETTIGKLGRSESVNTRERT